MDPWERDLIDFTLSNNRKGGPGTPLRQNPGETTVITARRLYIVHRDSGYCLRDSVNKVNVPQPRTNY